LEAEEIVQGTRDHAGRVCPVCQVAVREGDVLHLCPSCGATSHESCWRRSSGCQSYFCRRTARAERSGAPAISISRDDTDRLRPEQLLPASTSYPEGREGRYPKKLSTLAVIALVVAIVSVGTFGCVSLVLGAVALGMIANNSTLRGRWLAVSAMLLSIALMFGWGLALWIAPWNVGQLQDVKFRESPAALKDVPEPIRGSMRANVVVRTAGRGLMSRMTIGSGVILTMAPEGTLILTNRHVIDPGYKDNRAGPPGAAEIEVFFCSQEHVPATVKWVHPDGADLALLECRPANLTAPAAARLRLPATAPIGSEVYAVGNPMDLGWTYTKGVISNIREVLVNGKVLRVFQTQTPINQGNSGGGLYDPQGNLVGINTWTQSKGVAEGLSFAIAVEHAEEVLRPLIKPGLPAEAPAVPGGAVVPEPPKVPLVPAPPADGSRSTAPEGAR
jgi:S1-C subfamily serine protease